jgi:hypothetical protein
MMKVSQVEIESAKFGNIWVKKLEEQGKSRSLGHVMDQYKCVLLEAVSCQSCPVIVYRPQIYKVLKKRRTV